MISDFEDVHGLRYKRQIILADVNIPYKLSIDRTKNYLFFCINADEFSEQSFHSVALNLNTGCSAVIPGIRNGFASAVDQATGGVYIGGSDGIFKYNYSTNSVDHPPLINGIDIFDMHFSDDLYYVDTANQNLHVFKVGKCSVVADVKDSTIHHFVIDVHHDLYFVNSSGLFAQLKGCKTPILIDGSHLNIRGATTDVHGTPFFMAQNGIYFVEEESKQLVKVSPMENGYGLAFDADNNIIYSDERSVAKLIPL